MFTYKFLANGNSRSRGSKNSKINRQTELHKQTVSLNKGQINYITAYKIPIKCKIKISSFLSMPAVLAAIM